MNTKNERFAKVPKALHWREKVTPLDFVRFVFRPFVRHGRYFFALVSFFIRLSFFVLFRPGFVFRTPFVFRPFVFAFVFRIHQ